MSLRQLSPLSLSIFLLAVPQAAQASCGANACGPRDPIIYDAEAFAMFLNDMSMAPDDRMSLNLGKLSYIEAYAQAKRGPTKSIRSRFRWPRIRLPRFLSGEQSRNRRLVQDTAIRFALDPAYFISVAGRESQFDHRARAPTSSATGLFQFTDNTWLCTLKAYGERYGIQLAGAISLKGNGRCSVASYNIRWQLLALRYDPTLNATMAAHHTQDNQRELARLLGRNPTSAELYIFHFLGGREGQKFLLAAPEELGAQVVPRAAAANPTVFYTKAGRPRQVLEIKRSITASLSVN